MNSMKMKLLEQVLQHLHSSQGNDLKSLLDESKMPKEGMMKEENPLAGTETKPKGISVEKVSILGKPKVTKDLMGEEGMMDEDESSELEKPALGEEKSSLLPGEEEMTDDELEELLKKLT